MGHRKYTHMLVIPFLVSAFAAIHYKKGRRSINRNKRNKVKQLYQKKEITSYYSNGHWSLDKHDRKCRHMSVTNTEFTNLVINKRIE